jgi:hypothetical protein
MKKVSIKDRIAMFSSLSKEEDPTKYKKNNEYEKKEKIKLFSPEKEIIGVEKKVDQKELEENKFINEKKLEKKIEEKISVEKKVIVVKNEKIEEKIKYPPLKEDVKGRVWAKKISTSSEKDISLYELNENLVYGY